MLSGNTNIIVAFCPRLLLSSGQKWWKQAVVLCKVLTKNPFDHNMGKTQKKTGKGRIDKYYKLAK
jgi:hypothetical protein